jgi:AraC-like DNA-binding protein
MGCALDTGKAAPVTRVSMLRFYTDRLDSCGVRAEPLLERAGIPAKLLQFPSALVPLENAYAFAELACRAAGTEHLGVHIGLAASLDDLGVCGRILRNCVTLHEYFRKGIALFNMVVTGQRLWLSAHGQELRFNITTEGRLGLGPYQSQLSTLIVTIATCRQAAGPRWSPREISLSYRSGEALPEIDHFRGSRILRGTGQTYFTIPREMMRWPLRIQADETAPDDARAADARGLPESLTGQAEWQVEAMLPDRSPQVDLVAESLGVSTRSLQRNLAMDGLSFSQVLADVRLRSAVACLRTTDKPVTDLAFDLGYADASNFTRAFRLRTGMSPQRFRELAGRRAGRPDVLPA